MQANAESDLRWSNTYARGMMSRSAQLPLGEALAQ